MDDLTTASVELYTDGFLAASDPKTQQLLDMGLGRARQFCGWHVTPVMSATATIRGSGEQWIALHTLNIVSVTSITERVDGVDTPIDISEVEVLTDDPSSVYFKSHRCWHPSRTYTITFEHGYTADEAAAFNDAVLEWIDIKSVSIGTGGSGQVTEFRVDDVDTKWGGGGDRLPGALPLNPLSSGALYLFKILPVA